MEEKYRNAFSEVYLIIGNMHPDLRKRINKKFIEFLRDNKNNNYTPDPKKISIFKPENLLKETKIVLAILYEKNFNLSKWERRLNATNKKE